MFLRLKIRAGRGPRVRPQPDRRAVIVAPLLVLMSLACTLPLTPDTSPTPVPIQESDEPADDSPQADTETPAEISVPAQSQTPQTAESGTTPSPSAEQSVPTHTPPTPEVSSCAETWFFDVPAELADHCPQPMLVSNAAAQSFEQGTMIWLEQPGRYYMLTNQILYADEPRKAAYQLDDPLDITQDTSSDIEAPAGLFAPVSGFGLVWRGDVVGSSGFQTQLGWATAPEFAYQASLQCEVGSLTGGRSWQFCFLLAPNDDMIVFHPLDGWFWLSEWP